MVIPPKLLTNFLLLLNQIAVLGAGFLFYQAGSSGRLVEAVEAVLLLGGSLVLMRYTAQTIRHALKTTPSTRTRNWRDAVNSVGSFLIALIASLLVLGYLEFLKGIFTPQFFALLLILLVLYLVKEQLVRSSSPEVIVAGALIFYLILGVTSFFAIFASWRWQPWLVSLALACPVSAIEFVRALRPSPSTKPSKNGQPHRSDRTKLFAVLILGGPALIALLTTLGTLPKNYLATALVFPALAHLIQRFEKGTENPTEYPGILRQTAGVSTLFMIIIGLLTLTN